MAVNTVLVVLLVLVLVRLAVAVIRFVRLSPAGRRHWLPARWHHFRWRWLSVNLGLGYIDRHRKRLTRLSVLVPFTTSVRVQPPADGVVVSEKLRWPRARFRPDDYGFTARVRTVPRVGRAEFEEAAPYLADAWRCVRVSIGQPRPGRLVVRGLRRDPLAEPFPMSDAPAGVYRGLENQRTTLVTDVSRLYLGRDEWGADRWISLANITAAVVGGMPGTGKTTLTRSMLCQLAPSPVVRLAIADGQGGADFEPYRDRAYAYAGDSRAEGAELFEDVHAEMRRRYASVLDLTGHRNAWDTGPTEAFPLHFLVVDEAHGYLDESLAKGDKAAEAHVRTCRAMLGQLVRRGRSCLMFTLILSQKPTSDAVPSFISSNAGLRVAFGLQTIDGAVSVLGDSIRQYPTLSPLTLQGPESVGVLTARLTTAGAPFTRIRVPDIPESVVAGGAGVPVLGHIPPVTLIGAKDCAGHGLVKGGFSLDKTGAGTETPASG
jgi:DNA segregation ATPase FtsK/SpoIIIE, S-DNA-T family